MKRKPRKFVGHGGHEIKKAVVICDASFNKDGEMVWGNTHAPGIDPWYLLKLEVDAGSTYADLFPDLVAQGIGRGMASQLITDSCYTLTNGEAWYLIDNGEKHIFLTLDDQKIIQEAIMKGSVGES